MSKNKFNPTTEFIDDMPQSFWEEQYRFAALCVEIGKEKRAKYSEIAQTTGDWEQTNKAHRFVEFWEKKYQEAKGFLKLNGMIA